MFFRSTDSAEVTFSCKKNLKYGAILALPVTARREDTTALNCFQEWIIKHIDVLFVFTQKLGLGIEMEEIILVTGFHRTRSWSTVTFNEIEEDSQFSFGVKVAGASINWQRYSYIVTGGSLISMGPSGEVCAADWKGRWILNDDI